MIFFYSDVEDQENWHGKALGKKSAQALSHLQSLISAEKPGLVPAQPSGSVAAVSIKDIKLSSPPSYKMGDKVATRAAYGTALVKIGTNNSRVIALDAEVKNSTFSIKFKVRYFRNSLGAHTIGAVWSYYPQPNTLF